MNNLIKGGLLFLGGAAVGATVALLLAPKTGDETRKQLSDLEEKEIIGVEGKIFEI